MPSSFSYIAAGNILPSIFVSQATATSAATATGQFAVTAATGTGTPIIGISQPGTRGPVGTPFDDGYAANAGNQIAIYDNSYTDDVLLLLGQPVTAGDMLTSDTSGRGIPVTATSGAWFGAQALQTVSASGGLARVRPWFGRN